MECRPYLFHTVCHNKQYQPYQQSVHLQLKWLTMPVDATSAQCHTATSISAKLSNCVLACWEAFNCLQWQLQVLNGVNLASFSLVDCAQTLLGQRLEVVPYAHLATWAGLNTSDRHTP